MAVTAINSKPVRIGSAGGRIIIKTGGTNYNILNLRPGSEYSWEAGLNEVLHETSAGQLTTPQNGDAKPTKLSISGQYTSSAGANELQNMLMVTDNSSPDGYRKQFDVYIEIYDNPSATTCQQIRFQKCTVDSVKVKAGSKWDEIDVEFTDWETKPTIISGASPL